MNINDKEVQIRLNEMMKEEQRIVISMEEYKELLMIKGKYEELKSQQIINPIKWNEPTITKTLYGSGEPLPENLTKIYCEN